MFEKVVDCPECKRPITLTMNDYFPRSQTGWWFTCGKCGALSVFPRRLRLLLVGILLLCAAPVAFIGRAYFWPAVVASLAVAYFATAIVGRSQATLVPFHLPIWARRVSAITDFAAIPVALLLAYLVFFRLSH